MKNKTAVSTSVDKPMIMANVPAIESLSFQTFIEWSLMILGDFSWTLITFMRQRSI